MEKHYILSDPPRLRQPTMKHGFGPPTLFFGLSKLVRSNSMQNHPFLGSGPCTGLWNGPQGRRAHLVGFGGQIFKMLQFIQFLSNFSDILSKVATQEAPGVVFTVDLTKMHRNVIYGQYQLGQGRPDLPQRQFFLRRDTPQWFIQHKNRCQKVSSASDYLSGPIHSHLNPKNAKTRFLGVNRQKGLKKRCTVPQTCSKIWSDTWEGLWVTILLEFLKSDPKQGQDGGLKRKKKKNSGPDNHRPKPLKNGLLCTKHVQKI